MTDIQGFLASIRRPCLLIRAARFGVLDYRRDRDLRRVLGLTRLPAPAQALPVLAAAEEQAETTRRAGDAAYSVTRHVELLIALMGEARALQAWARG
jgi:hypothetical protein